MQRLHSICFLFLLSLLTANTALSQAVNATLVGTITDASGGAVPKAQILITETNTGINKTGVANESGNYIFPDLPPGTYSVTAEHPGFKKETRRDIEVLVNSNTRVDLKLMPGNVSETIEVTGALPLMQTDRSDVGRTMDAQMVEDLPLGVNRNFQSLLDLVPGTTPANFEHSQFFNASSSLQTKVNGQPRMANSLQIEGIDDNQRTGLLQILIPPAEAIQTVSVSTSNHDPELGRGTGAITNLVMRSGTNRFNGAVYEFVQNSALDARSFFNPTVGHLAYNQFGGRIGGPIKHNKLFFFADYQRTEDHEANTNQTTIPSMAFHHGDLSADPKHQVYDPFSGNPATGAGRTPFTGNIIPESMINRISAKILALLPAPNEPFVESAPSNNYFALLPARKTNDQVDTKLDYTPSEKDRFSGRFSFARPVSFQAPIFGDAGGPAQGNFQGSGFQKTYSGGINYNRVISSTLLTEIRVGVAHYHNEARQSDYGKADTTALGIPNVNVNDFTSGFVGISIGGGFSTPLTGYSASLPWIRAEANIDLVNSWTKVLRNHTIKFGVDLRRIRDDLLQDQTFSPRGVITFSANQTSTPGGGATGLANDMASFLLDVPSKVARDVNTYFPAFRAWQIFSYAADNWQVSPKFTIQAGLRWEIYPPPTPEFKGGFSNYNFASDTLVIAGIGNNPMNMGLKTNWKYFAPRVGIAYRLTEKTVIRSGFGLSYTPFPDNTWAYNYPVRANNQYTQLNGVTYLPAAYPDGSLATFQKGFPAPQPIVVPSNGIITNPDPTSAYSIIPLDYKNPAAVQWNFAIQRALPLRFVIDVAYVGNHGVRTPAAVNLNAGQVIGLGSKGQPQYPRTADTTQYFQGYSSSYNALQVKLDRGFSSGLGITTSFSWSKAMDVQSGDDGGLFFFVNKQRNYARADFDRTLNYVQSFIYQLPFGHGKRFLAENFLGKIVGGWQASGILSARTGTPLTIEANDTLNLPASKQTPNQIAPVTILNGINVGNPWFSKSSFATPVGQVFGSMGRNVFSGPGLFGLNVSLIRRISIRERYELQLRADSLNVTNTPQFSNPQVSMTNNNFGYITGTLSSGTGVNGTGGGRVVTGGVKLTF
jgi:hypothetical protein